ncbi:MAG: A24 family peptidase [Acidimicrobiaceae bacterium]|nr:A24 family peptidase [Acidimicrobiaceae bacterium]
MSPAALAAAALGGFAVGRLGALVADRFAPARGRLRRFPSQEAVTGVLAAAVVARFGVGWEMVPALVAAVSLVTMSAVDLRTYRLPDALTFPALGLSLAAVAAESLAAGRGSAVVAAVSTGAGLGAAMWILHEIRPAALGFGDVKLAPMLGVNLGWAAASLERGWTAAVVLASAALLFASVVGGVLGLALALLHRRGVDALPDPERSPDAPARRLRDTVVPFGPALSAGTMAALLLAPAIGAL